MGSELKYVYCVVKSTVIRKRDGSIVCSIPFGNPFHVLGKEDGLYYGEAYKANEKGNIKYRGFVDARGFSKDKIVDMSYLHYRNKTGQRIPTTMRYKGVASSWLEPDEEIHVLFRSGDWMLTGKGWTKAEWLEKVRIICDYENMKTLVYAVITQTVKDYTSIVRGLQAGFTYYTRDCPDSIAEMLMIRKWFVEGNYLKIIADQYSGEERLEMIDKDLGVTDEWLQKISSKERVKSRFMKIQDSR